MSVRVAFAATPSSWLGGRNYMRSLVAAIQSLRGNPLEPIILAGRGQEDVSVDFPNTQIIRSALFDQRSPLWFLRKVVAKAYGEDVVLSSFLKHHKVSVLSHSFHLGMDAGTNTKSIGWIADMQHVRMPGFFDESERLCRDRDYRMLCERCDRVIVSSECARSDLAAFVPEHAQKLELLRFVASPAPLTRASSLGELRNKYKFNGHFFLLPNQFWAHKNHIVVINALAELQRQGDPMLVLATGSIADSRNPSFFPSLMKHARDRGVLDNFRVLGQIPYDDIVGLMQNAVALINPSLFEGWSTSVEEAKSMGKRIVLSDLPVHREQAPEGGVFFSPTDPTALAAALRKVRYEYDESIDLAMQRNARRAFPERLTTFGRSYQQIIERALSGH